MLQEQAVALKINPGTVLSLVERILTDKVML